MKKYCKCVNALKNEEFEGCGIYEYENTAFNSVTVYTKDNLCCLTSKAFLKHFLRILG